MPHFTYIARGLLLALTLSGPATAASILDPGPHASTYHGFGRGYWFEAPTAFAIIGVRVPTDASPLPQTAEIVRFNSTPASFPLVSNDFTSLGRWTAAGADFMDTGLLAVSRGDLIGVLGTRFLTSSYGAGPYTTEVAGEELTLNRLGMLNDFLAFGNAYNLMTEDGPIGRVELRYENALAAGAATPVPEPSTFVLMASGLLALALVGRRRLAAKARPHLCLSALALGSSLTLGACQGGSSPQAASQDDPVSEWHVSDDFGFDTGNRVEASIRAVDSQDRPLQGLYLELVGPQGVLLAGAPAEDGFFEGAVLVPSYLEELTLRGSYLAYEFSRRLDVRHGRVAEDLSDLFDGFAPGQGPRAAGKATGQLSDNLYSLVWSPAHWNESENALALRDVDDSGVDVRARAAGSPLLANDRSYNRGGHHSLVWQPTQRQATRLVVAFSGNSVDFLNFSILDLDAPDESARITGYSRGLPLEPVLSPYRPEKVRLANGVLTGTDRVADGRNDADIAVLFLSAVDSVVVELRGAGDIGVSNFAFSSFQRLADSDGDGLHDGIDRFPAQGDKAFVFYAPGQDVKGTLAFEDLWPAQGDFDFNDLVVDYSIEFHSDSDNRIVEIVADLFVKHVGAAYRNGFGFELPVPPDAVASFEGGALRTGLIETLPNGLEAGQPNAVLIAFDDAAAQLNGHLELRVRFAAPQEAAALGTAPFNPFIFVNGDRSTEVHLADMRPTGREEAGQWGRADDTSDPAASRFYKTADNLPWAIHVIQNFAVPVERVPIYESYRHFSTWAQSGGQLYPDWYLDHKGYRDPSRLY